MEKLYNDIDQELLIKRKNERKEDFRGSYYRDTTAIIHSSPFRRLKHKTQVFFAPSNDHICTRMEHVLHVSSIASTICRPLGLDTELAWAIGMGHDLGHTPFGHVGEIIMDKICKQKGLGNFEHEVNSLRVVDRLSEKGKGLNLTYAVRDGIVSHCGEHFVQRIKPSFEIKDLDGIKTRIGLIPTTFEATVVRFSDSIAYLGRDFEDASRLGILTKPLPDCVKRDLGSTNGEIINTLVTDIIENSSQSEGIGFSDKVYKAVEVMKDYNYNYIYKSDILKGYNTYFNRLLNLIYSYLEGLFDDSSDPKEACEAEKNMLAAGFYAHYAEMKDVYKKMGEGKNRLIFDYVAGMSDNFALDCANEILKPEHLNDKIELSLRGKWFDA
ncbi:MAG: HD domain-containing protein [Spirochaetales bacterium]|uniref:deoxyguanosinetriphosphate triphosphohydrolase family protein n=1 Tax=Bullifex sp. TaxID=2815808 RepID=UPI002A4FFC37|nr:HD domain-containing protein [Bullifex sp.]MDD5973890.1 HD domain-containing protein [Spirochaetales bacterium]MDD7270395.1 HD domain-containing protein [Spirochaetales bacterium]MDY4067021.1 HD domain-containing protein [Bullifex sp.]